MRKSFHRDVGLLSIGGSVAHQPFTDLDRARRTLVKVVGLMMSMTVDGVLMADHKDR